MNERKIKQMKLCRDYINSIKEIDEDSYNYMMGMYSQLYRDLRDDNVYVPSREFNKVASYIKKICLYVKSN